MRGEDSNDRAHNLILHSKDIIDLAIVVLGPAVSACPSIDQLGGDAYAIATPPHTSFQHIAHSEFAADLADIRRFTLVLKAGIARDHEQLADARQLGDEILYDAVGEILLLGITAQVGEGENGDGRLLRHAESGLLNVRRVRKWLVEVDAISPHRLRDVLQLVQSEILADHVHLARNLFVDFRRNTDATWLGHALQTRGYIHPITVDPGFVMDDITLVDTDPELNSARLFDLGVALPHDRLDCDRAFDGVHDAPKLSQHPVACSINDPASVLPNHREDDYLVRFQITNGGCLVGTHEDAIASDIGSKDRCQFAGNLRIFRNIGHPRQPVRVDAAEISITAQSVSISPSGLSH